MGIKKASSALAVVCLASAALAACGGGEEDRRGGANSAAETAAAANTAGGGAVAPSANIDEEIDRLERHAERTPTDDEVRKTLAEAYVKRANARRAAGDLQAALKDFRRAIIYDEDNLEAQKSIAELRLQVEGERTGEYGEPEPPPISPGVTAGEEDAPTTSASPVATPAASSSPRRRP